MIRRNVHRLSLRRWHWGNGPQSCRPTTESPLSVDTGLAVEPTAVLEVLEKDDAGAGVLYGVPSGVVGSRAPCVYRRGGLNLVNRLGVGDVSGQMCVSVRCLYTSYAVTYTGGIVTVQRG